MQYTQAQIDRANAVSLEDFLRTQGETLIKSGREYRWKEHDSLTVRGNKWFRHSQSKGGYPIDFVMEFYGKSFPEAVQLLTGESAEGQSEASTAPPTAFHLPLHNRTADRAIQYLTESRGLNKTLVEAFLLSGDIYEDAKRHNVVFVGRDRSGTPRYAHVRGTADPFRQDIAGSDKSYPFHYEGNGNQLFVFEAPIDLLSFIDTLMLPPCLVPSYRHRPMMNSHRAFFIYRRILNEQYRNQQHPLPDCQKADRQDNLYRPCPFQPDRQRDDGGQNQAYAS